MIPVSTDAAASNYAGGPSEHVSVRHRLVVRLLVRRFAASGAITDHYMLRASVRPFGCTVHF